jgi:hypothetical protein
LKLECDEPLSNFAFNFNLRRYILLAHAGTPTMPRPLWKRSLRVYVAAARGGAGAPSQKLQNNTEFDSSNHLRINSDLFFQAEERLLKASFNTFANPRFLMSYLMFLPDPSPGVQQEGKRDRAEDPRGDHRVAGASVRG